MSNRSGYVDDLEDDDPLAYGRWRGRVASVFRSRRGQAFFVELRDALDAMPEKSLIAEELACDDGVCAMGAVGQKRGINMADIDPEDSERVAATFGIHEVMAREIAYMNDEWGSSKETPEQRWSRMRKWVESKIKSTQVATPPADEKAVKA